MSLIVVTILLLLGYSLAGTSPRSDTTYYLIIHWSSVINYCREDLCEESLGLCRWSLGNFSTLGRGRSTKCVSFSTQLEVYYYMCVTDHACSCFGTEKFNWQYSSHPPSNKIYGNSSSSLLGPLAS